MRKQTKLVAVLSAAALLAIGASMTSFAKGWTQEDDTWVYLDGDGDRVTETWKKSGSSYYWLDEDGVMATDTLVDDGDNKYYVDGSGKRVINDWRSVPNEDDETVGNNDDIDILWYYFGSSGKAYTDTKKSINGRYYIFDEEGHAISGWHWYDGYLYYLGTEDECWAYTGWQYLELDEDVQTIDYEEYDDEEWFYFAPATGKAHVSARKYIEGRYYTFDENGVMLDKWVFGTPGATSVTATDGVATDGAARYLEDNGAQRTGWVYTYETDDPDENGDEQWFYLDAKGVPFNYKGKDSEVKVDGEVIVSSVSKKTNEIDGVWGTPLTYVAAKVVKTKTYLFNSEGVMQTGVFKTLTPVARTGGEILAANAYYGFNKNGGSVKGQMLTGKVSVDYDGETVYYNFQKNGQAYVDTIADGVLYGHEGTRVNADDGNNYELITLDYDTKIKGGSTIEAGKEVIVSSTGKVKKSGTVKIDGIKYTVSNYVKTKEEAVD